MDTARTYTTRRMAIVKSLVSQLEQINGTGEFFTSVAKVEPRLRFWDEVEEFPTIHVNAGSEIRQYQGGGYRDRFLTVTFRLYVKEENASDALELLLADVETVLENNGRLAYLDPRGATQYTHDIKIISIDTDEGVLEPLGVAEIIAEVNY